MDLLLCSEQSAQTYEKCVTEVPTVFCKRCTDLMVSAWPRQQEHTERLFHIPDCWFMEVYLTVFLKVPLEKLEYPREEQANLLQVHHILLHKGRILSGEKTELGICLFIDLFQFSYNFSGKQLVMLSERSSSSCTKF